MSTLVVNEISGLADPLYTMLPEGIVDPNVLEFRLINEYKRITIKKNSLDSSYFTADFLPEGSITREKIATEAVGSNELADGSVTTAKLADRSVTTIKIALGAVTNEEIATGGILAHNIANDAVVTDTIRNAAVTNPKLADDCITSRNLSPSSVDNQSLQTACVTLDKLGPDVFTFIQTASAFPAGTVIMTARATIPNGYLLCDGAQVSRSIYSGLFNAIGGTYGPGDGSTSFNLPDFRGRTAIGAGAGGGLTNRGLGSIGGTETHQLTDAEMPYHSHSITDHGHSHAVNEPAHGHSISQVPHGHAVAYGGGSSGLEVQDYTGAWHASEAWMSNVGTRLGAMPMYTFTERGEQRPQANPYRLRFGGAGSIGIYGADANISVIANFTGISIAGAYANIGIAPAGSSVPHNNMQPFVAINYCIKT